MLSPKAYPSNNLLHTTPTFSAVSSRFLLLANGDGDFHFLYVNHASVFCSLAALFIKYPRYLQLRRMANRIKLKLYYSSIVSHKLQFLGISSDDHFRLCCVTSDGLRPGTELGP